jgi:3'(2'), 5'-bisphosphate nucleotidase
MMQLDDQQADAIALQLVSIAIEAGGLLRGLQSRPTEHHLKWDGTPTCEADSAAETLIVSRLHERWAGVPVVAEESADAERPGERFFLVDPLDGTSDFIHGTAEFTVNIALIRSGRPVAAVVAAPAMGRIWMAGESARSAALSGGADIVWQPARARPAPDKDLVALVSRRHGDEATEACLATLSIGTRRTASSALKFCFIASGDADVYVRCGPTMEWDTAAGDHILARAGGCVVGPDGKPLTYGHEERGYRNGPFAALGDAALAPRLALPSAIAS